MIVANPKKNLSTRQIIIAMIFVGCICIWYLKYKYRIARKETKKYLPHIWQNWKWIVSSEFYLNNNVILFLIKNELLKLIFFAIYYQLGAKLFFRFRFFLLHIVCFPICMFSKVVSLYFII